MEQYIDKAAVVAEIESLRRTTFTNFDEGVNATVQTLLEVVDTLEVKEDIKPKLLPSKKQLEALKDLLHYNIGVFDYQKCMEVNSLYENLIKVLDYETDR